MARLFAAAIAASLMIGSQGASAAPGTQTLDFRYTKADVETAEAAAKLYERINVFAAKECETISSPAMINPRARQCAKELSDKLIASINSPLLSAHAQQHVTLAVVE